jgi:glycine hydroxymethyltransferase
MDGIVGMIDAILCDVENEELIAKTRSQVNEMMHERPLFAW